MRIAARDFSRARLAGYRHRMAAQAARGAIDDDICRRLVSDQIDAATGELRIGHPLGVMAVRVTTQPGLDALEPAFAELGIARTARRLMDGSIYVPTQDAF